MSKQPTRREILHGGAIGMSAAFTGTSKDLGIKHYRGSMAFIEHDTVKTPAI